MSSVKLYLRIVFSFFIDDFFLEICSVQINCLSFISYSIISIYFIDDNYLLPFSLNLIYSFFSFLASFILFSITSFRIIFFSLFY
jgi:hypothetical protein